MASDPELQRFAGSFVRRLEGGQSRIGRPMTTARTCAPSQHLSKKVLHFVCELRGPIATELSISRRLHYIAMTRRMGPRLRGDDSGDSLLHIFERGDERIISVRGLSLHADGRYLRRFQSH